MVEITLRYRGRKGVANPSVINVSGFTTSNSVADLLVDASLMAKGAKSLFDLAPFKGRPSTGCRYADAYGLEWWCRKETTAFDRCGRVQWVSYTIRVEKARVR